MRSCNYCNNLEIPSYQTVEKSKAPRTYNALSIVPSNRPQGIKPHIVITNDGLLTGASVLQCDTCSMLKNALLAILGGSLDDLKEIQCLGYESGTMMVVVVSKDGQRRHFEFYTNSDSTSPWPAIGVGRSVSSVSSSDACMELAASWIKECIESHKDCLRLDETPLPTRVIHVGSNLEEPYLYVSKKENAEYIALSHCWGGNVPITTTLATLEQRQQKICFSEFPKTFQDALSIARKLNVQYLWIDSLCIIQDSKDDWEKEAEKMANVYRNSFICIAADGATNSHGGCFITGHPGRNLDIARIQFPGPAGANNSINIRKEPHTQYSLGELVESALDKRGWILQEQALSRRTLRYKADEMSWDCATCLQCECTIRPRLIQSIPSTWQLLACKRMIQHASKPDFGNWFQSSRWVNFVELFTERSLTCETDRLHALCGIAAIMSSPEHGAFLAGLWREELPLALLWRTKVTHDTREKVVSQRHQNYYAPFWSWASLTGPVEYLALPGREYNFRIVPDLRILEAECVPAGLNAYGPVRSGYLKVSGLLARLYPEGESVSYERTMQNDGRKIDRRFWPDVSIEGRGPEIEAGVPLWMLLIAHGERLGPGFSKLEGYHCLVLRKPSHLQDQSIFERIGCKWGFTEYWELELSGRAELQTITLL